ncbi:phosphoenolpyruvate--protein phosphotransferase [Desulfosarcina ovata]|uniref:phosphoenolpyruvate--protein phosphotransferase n=1 Tax=Desulfosarcina ovata subsp. ovata TaxID=2752305 RepID=A0A5K8ABI0_9BACT|nr:phosphoenolpyruvate--protein phosphotransferase [Desulfosarcina ovata]BBO90002.1 phosphoenolpyruvate--protein phosphotransferase [Desulfosarcina ovata subsp. ovata]
MTAKRQDLLNMLCDLSDLSALVTGSENIENFLQRTVLLVSGHLETPVCSIYLYDETADELVLKATVGLNPEAVDRVRMGSGQGLVGTVMASSQPVCEGHASQSPRFRYFPETDELLYESFLAVPIRKGVVKIGVLVVQHTEPDYFDTTDITALKATAAQLAAVLENARLLMDLQRMCSIPEKLACNQSFIKGQRAAGGFAFGRARVWGKSHVRLIAGPDTSESGDMADFRRAIGQTAAQLDALQRRCAERLPESASLIFAAHFMMLKDPKFIDRMVEKIESGSPATRAVRDVAGQYIQLFTDSPHPYIREKVSDIEDLAGRLMSNLVPLADDQNGNSGGKVVIARELYPSELLKLAAESVAGIVLANGGVTSHVAIISRSLKIPMVVVQCPELMHLDEGTPVLIDGDVGNVFVDPDKTVIDRYDARNQARRQVPVAAEPQPAGPTRTLDGTRIHLLANINLLAELPLAGQMGAAGIGLYRTEFPFLIRPSFPSETEQYLVYRKVVESMTGKPVVFRTLDIGGEKTLSYADAETEPNPELGLRSIRFTLAYRDIFEQQVRAILRAAAGSRTPAIMFPLISSVDDFRKARQVVTDCLDQLRAEGLEHHDHPAIGMMVELPAVVESMAEFAAEADFFAIGTNDFVQYMLGVDRSNKRVADYYRPEHPSVLRALNRVVRVAIEHKKPISICGEMAHDETMIPFLLGIGMRRLSIDPQFMPAVRTCITGLTIDACQAYAGELLAAGSVSAVREILSRQPNLAA